jgi:glycosyltransferase involved in cell wall biosynthesis
MTIGQHGRGRVLFVTSSPAVSAIGGRQRLGLLNRGILSELFGDHLVVVELKRPVRRSLKSLAGAFQGYIDGLNRELIAQLIHDCKRGEFGLVFLDGSNLGELASAVKRAVPFLPVCTFCHNVEARFFWGALKQRRSLRALAVLAVNYLAERKSVRHSDTLIALSTRDSLGLQRLYGRGATHISAMALDEPPTTPSSAAGERQRYVLFVGGNFYANRAGMRWFAEKVAPRVAMKALVVGQGFEALKAELDRPGQVEVIGTVDGLAPWYRGAHVVIAPIFDGSGMKTKVAEALMFGKKIVGTTEAFSGYEDVTESAGWCCATADEFVAALTKAETLELPEFDPALWALYHSKFSRAAACKRMAQILGTKDPEKPNKA